MKESCVNFHENSKVVLRKLFAMRLHPVVMFCNQVEKLKSDHSLSHWD